MKKNTKQDKPSTKEKIKLIKKKFKELKKIIDSETAENFEKIIEAAENGDEEAMCFLADTLSKFGDNDFQSSEEYAHDDPEEDKLAVQQIRKMAEKGKSHYQLVLGALLLEGQHGVKQDFAEAEKWLLKAAENGSTSAAEMIAFEYITGKRLKKDPEKARELFEANVKNKSSYYSFFCLGKMFVEGLGGPKDISKGLTLIETAASNGIDDAYSYLADLYRDGEYGMRPDKNTDVLAVFGEKALKEYFSAIQYIKDITAKKTIKKGIMLLKKAAENKNIPALITLGREYLTGENVSKDIEEARRLWQIAGENGGNEGFFNIGMSCLFFDKKHYNPEMAFDMFQKAASMNYPRAYDLIGYLYSEGIGVKRNYKKAIESFEKSIEMGFLPAKVSLAAMYLDGARVRKNKTKAIKMLTEAAYYGEEKALIMLYKVYSETKKNKEKAEKILRQAQIQDCQGAIAAINAVQDKEIKIPRLSRGFFICGPCPLLPAHA